MLLRCINYAVITSLYHCFMHGYPAGYVTKVRIRTPNNCVARELALHAIVLKFGEQRDLRFRQSQTEFLL